MSVHISVVRYASVADTAQSYGLTVAYMRWFPFLACGNRGCCLLVSSISRQQLDAALSGDCMVFFGFYHVVFSKISCFLFC